MPRQVFAFDPPERFVAGTVGDPGARAFYLQASAGGRVTTIALEKVQVQVLAERLGDLLDEVRRRGGDVPATTPPDQLDVAPLDQPILEEFRVGELRLAWDGEDGIIVIEALAVSPDAESDEDTEDERYDEAAVDEDEDATDGPDIFRVRMLPGMARGFVERALRVVAAGRPPCPLCGLPLDPEGHVCPRQNGRRH